MEKNELDKKFEENKRCMVEITSEGVHRILDAAGVQLNGDDESSALKVVRVTQAAVKLCATIHKADQMFFMDLLKEGMGILDEQDAENKVKGLAKDCNLKAGTDKKDKSDGKN